MCVSSGLKALNNTVKGVLNTAKSEAASVFGASSSVFNNIIGGLQQIVTGGPSQAGYSAAETNAMNAAAVQGGATMARNLGAAAGTSAAAVGGGNTATPGAITSAELAAKTAAAQETAGAENQIVQQSYEQGNKNYEAAVGQEMALPNVFNAATSSEGAVNDAAKNATAVQTEMDKQSNWWQPMVTAAIGGASSALTSGLMSGMGGGGGGGGLSDADTMTPGAAPFIGGGTMPTTPGSTLASVAAPSVPGANAGLGF
jgi:hypothetical protein